MERATVERICIERLAKWSADLAEETATPLVLIAVRHDDPRGQLVVCTEDDVSDDALVDLLVGTAQLILRGQRRRNGKR